MRIAPLFVFLGALQLAPAAYAQEVPISDNARSHFTAGVNLMQDPDGARYEEAYREFSAAYADSPSWKILGNLGIAAMKLERDGEAIVAFEKYLAEGAAALSPEEQAQFKRDLDTLKAGVVKLSIDVNEPGVTIVDERLPVAGSSVRNSYAVSGQRLEIGVRSGRHKIVAKLAGRQEAVWELDAVSGVPQTHAFVLKPEAAATTTGGGDAPAASSSRPIPTGVYVGLAATGVFAVGAGVVGAMALSKNSEYKDANNGGNVSKAEDLHSSVNTLNLVTDIMIGAAIVSAGVTTYLYLSRPKADVASSGWIRVQPEVGHNAGALRVTGAF
jgi:hypothetical protein